MLRLFQYKTETNKNKTFAQTEFSDVGFLPCPPHMGMPGATFNDFNS